MSFMDLRLSFTLHLFVLLNFIYAILNNPNDHKHFGKGCMLDINVLRVLKLFVVQYVDFCCYDFPCEVYFVLDHECPGEDEALGKGFNAVFVSSQEQVSFARSKAYSMTP